MATGTCADWVTELSDYGLGDDVAPDTLWDTINRVIQDVNSRQAWPFLQTTASLTLTAGQAQVTLPARFNKVRSFVIDSQGRILVPDRRENIVKKFVGSLTSTGLPSNYYFIGNSMFTFPIPDQAYTATLDFVEDEVTVSAATALSSLLMPQKHHEVYFLGILSRLYAMEDDTEMYGLFTSRFEQKIVDMMDDLSMHDYDMPDYVVDVWDDGLGSW